MNTFFFNIMLIFSYLHGHKMHWLGYPPSQIHTESHSSVKLCPVFYLKAYMCHTEPFRKKLDGLFVTSPVIGNNMQYKAIYAKTISSWVRNILCIAKAHTSLGSLRCHSIYSLGSWCFPGVHPEGRWLGQSSTPARHYFYTYITTTNWHKDSVQHAVLGLHE